MLWKQFVEVFPNTFDSYKNDILSNSGIHWLKSAGFNGGSDSLIFTEMKVRRKL